MKELIICATDFSPQAETALAWAAALARRDGDHVDLVYVAPALRQHASLVVFDTAQFDDEQVRIAGDRLRESARVASNEHGVTVRPQLLHGEPHEAILKHGRDGHARMLVLGAGELATVQRWLLGSVAERTVRSADRPVVLVPRRPEPSVWMSSGTGAERTPRVLAGLGTGDDAALLRFVSGLRRQASCDVTFLHLYWPIEEYARLGLQGRRDLFEADPDVVKNLEPALRLKVGGLPGRGAMALEIRPAWGEPASNLMVAVEDSGADLLVVGAHERHGLARSLTGSIAQRLARHARYVPIAVVPADVVPATKPAGIPTLCSVLAATDFSPLGNAAVAHAYALLRAGGVVELCHITERVLPSPAYAYDATTPAITEIDRERMLQELRDLIPPEARELGITTHVSIVDGGKPGEAIVQAAERLNVDAITLASHGHSGLARAVLGSVAQEVIHRAHRPVFVVRRH